MGVLVRGKCIWMSDKRLINHLQRLSLQQGKAMPSPISTQSHPSNITGHKNLHQTINVSRRPPLPSHPCRDVVILGEGTLEARPPLAPVVGIYLRERDDMEIDNITDKEMCVSSDLDQNREEEGQRGGASPVC
ncbi:unnamed protein product [Pleuronectes platessa]|uniref:Uncharacterized protein n=1 Tax=Pleuronectes platessa TaxID=8262 RepID=A0A9N7VV18_PLEPL|nr:unnamed protein product [Pleuronectes platessa]